jgi:hypothetical protein
VPSDRRAARYCAGHSRSARNGGEQVGDVADKTGERADAVEGTAFEAPIRLALRYPGAVALLARLAFLVPARYWPRRNVDLVLTLQLPPTEDFALLLRDDKAWAALVKCFEPLFHPDFETVAPGVPGTEKPYTGLDGLRAAWLEWVAPWASYRTETAVLVHQLSCPIVPN